MVDDTTQPADTEPQSEEPLTWEKQKNLEYRQRFMVYAKKFAMGFLILLIITLALRYSDYDLDEDVGVMGYNISVGSFLTFLWIILFTLFLSHAVPIGLLLFVNRFIVQMRETGPDEPHVSEEVISEAEAAAGTDDADDGPGDGVSDPDGPGGDEVADPDGPKEDEVADPDGPEGEDVADPDGPKGDEVADPDGPQGDDPSPKKDVEDVLHVPAPQMTNKKEEEKESRKGIMAFVSIFTRLPPDADDSGEDPGKTEDIIYSFIRYMIIIGGFTYAFFALGIDLEQTVCVLGEDISAEIILDIVLTALITAVFVAKFLKLFLNLVLNMIKNGYRRGKDITEAKVKRMDEEVEKVRPGLWKTLSILVILFASLYSLSLIECVTEYIFVSEWDPVAGHEVSKQVALEGSDLCQYIEDAEMILQSLAILFTALMLTTITPLFVYMMAKGDEDIRKSGMYKAARYINYFILIIAMFLILSIVGLDLSTAVPIGESKISLWSIISALVVIILSNVFAKLVTAILRDTALNPKQMEEHASIVMEKFIHVVIVGVGFFVALGILGINILALATGLGLLGFALAFGMQDTIANFVAGIMIAIERPFQIGDRVRIGEEWGDVIDIGMRSTKIRTAKNETVVIPNNLVATREVWNYTKDSPVISNVIPIGISYDSDPVLAEQIILDEAMKHPQIIDRPKAHVRMIQYGDSSIDFELWAWIANARQRDIVRSDLLKAIQLRFREEGIEIPFPHRTLTFKKGAAEEIAGALKKK